MKHPHVCDFSPVPPLTVEKDKALQILINVIHNAGNACSDAPADASHEKVITLIIEPAPLERVRVIVRDNGVGIAPENLTRIFAHGFTTRAEGRGFALHASSLAASEMQGSLTASSEGLGKGASFTLELPIAPSALGRFSGYSAFPEPSPYASSMSSGEPDSALAAESDSSR